MNPIVAAPRGGSMSREPGPLPTLMCPRCRRPPHSWPIIHDGLQCSNLECEHVFDTLDGTDIPIVLSGTNASFLEFDAAADFGDVDGVADWLAALEPGSGQWELALRTGMYAASHYDSADPLAARVCERFIAGLPTPPRTVLELGCGVGGFSNLMASNSACDVVGLDASGTAGMPPAAFAAFAAVRAVITGRQSVRRPMAVLAVLAVALAACGDDSSEPSATYVGGGCEYTGPSEFDLGSTVTFTVTNDSETTAVGFGVLALPEGATSEEILEEGIIAVVDEEAEAYGGAWPPTPIGVSEEVTVTFDTSGLHGINCFDQSGGDHDGDGLDYMLLFTVNE